MIAYVGDVPPDCRAPYLGSRLSVLLVCRSAAWWRVVLLCLRFFSEKLAVWAPSELQRMWLRTLEYYKGSERALGEWDCPKVPLTGQLAELMAHEKASCDPCLAFLQKGSGHGRPGGEYHRPVHPEVFEQLHFSASGGRIWTGCFHLCPRFSADAVPTEHAGEWYVLG